MNNHQYHQYIRVKPERKHASAITWFKCSIIGCVHKIKKEFIIGRIARCPKCGENYAVLKKHTTLATLHCDKCTDSQKQRDINKLDDVMKDLGI